MRKYFGGTTVTRGLYWNHRAWDVTVISAPGGTLPDTADTRFTRIPALALFVVAPLVGALYVIFLPLAGFALVAKHGGRKAAWALRHAWAAVLGAFDEG